MKKERMGTGIRAYWEGHAIGEVIEYEPSPGDLKYYISNGVAIVSNIFNSIDELKIANKGIMLTYPKIHQETVKTT